MVLLGGKLLYLLFILSELRDYVSSAFFEVIVADLFLVPQVLVRVGHCRSDQPFDFGSREIFCPFCQLVDGYLVRQKPLILNLFQVNLENLLSPFLRRQEHLYMNFKSAWPQQSLID